MKSVKTPECLKCGAAHFVPSNLIIGRHHKKKKEIIFNALIVIRRFLFPAKRWSDLNMDYADLSNFKILLIEDDASTMMMVNGILRAKFQCEAVEGCVDANEALDLLKSKSFDLIITDLIMPGVSGYEFGQEIKNRSLDTPVVAISSLSDSMKDKLEKSGLFSGILVKPFKADEFQKILDQLGLP